MDEVKKLTHIYYWGNNPVRERLKGRKCRVITGGNMNTVLIEFENGEKVTTSRRALRRIYDRQVACRG